MKLIKQAMINTTTPFSITDSSSDPLQSLPLVETFHSIQGEGYWTGTNAFFIRLAGCDVACPWCDTKHSWNAKRHPQRDLATLLAEVQTTAPKIVVITGGEPLMHNLSALTHRLRTAGFLVHLETSGSHPLSGTFDWITLSPKRFKPPRPDIYPHVSELKVVIAEDTDLAWAEAQYRLVSSKVIKLLQPEWETPGSSERVFNYVLQHPEWRISLQTHKLMGVQ